MVDTALNEWAQHSEQREVEQQLREQLQKQINLNKELQAECKVTNLRWSRSVGVFIKKLSKNREDKADYYLAEFQKIFKNV